MKLAKYLELTDSNPAQFSRRVGFSAPTIHKVIAEGNISAYVAIIIEMETKGLVTVEEMVSEKHIEKYLQKKRTRVIS